jgi:hypothetical protein
MRQVPGGDGVVEDQRNSIDLMLIEILGQAPREAATKNERLLSRLADR